LLLRVSGGAEALRRAAGVEELLYNEDIGTSVLLVDIDVDKVLGRYIASSTSSSPLLDDILLVSTGGRLSR